MELKAKRAVFLDRDGTLIEEKEYLSRPEQVVLYGGAGGALRRLREAGFLVILVSNQSGVGRGYFTMEDVARVHARLEELLAVEGAKIDGVYVAPEAPGEPSRGRKPSPQFLYDAREAFGVELGASYMIGDKLIDLQCGWNAGLAASVLVRTGYGRKYEKEAGRAVVVEDLAAAADWILCQGEGRARQGGGR